MKKTLLTIFTMLGLAICTLNAQETEQFKPSGKTEVLIFTDFNNTSVNGLSQNKFEVSRAYLGYGYNFTKAFSSRVVLDFANPGVAGTSAYTAILKYAYLQYQENNLTVRFGSIPTTHVEAEEKQWGNRYIMKTFEDLYSFNPSADLGFSVGYKFNDFISADAILSNGEGYKSLETDSILKVGVGVTIHPIKELLIRGFYDSESKNGVAQQTTALMVGYSNKTFNLAAEYNNQANNKYKNGYNYGGYSVFGTLFFNSKTGILARYDNLRSSDNTGKAKSWNFAKDGSQFIFGFQWTPLKGIRITPNYQVWTPRDGTKTNTSAVFMNVEIKI